MGFKKFLKITSVCFVVLLFLIAGAAYLLISKPEIVINTKNLNRVLPKLSERGINIKLKHADIKIASQSLLHKVVDISLGDFCIDMKDPLISGCFEKFIFSADFNISKSGIVFNRLGPLTLVSKRFDVKLSDSNDKEEKKSSSPLNMIKPHTEFGALDINLAAFHLGLGQSNYLIQTFVSGKLPSLDIRGHFQEQNGSLDIKAKLQARAPRDLSKAKWVLNGPVTVRVGKNLLFDAKLNYQSESSTAGQYVMGLKIKHPAVNYNGNLIGKRSGIALDGNLNGALDLKKLVLQLGNAKLDKKCSYELNWPKVIDIDCPVLVTSTTIEKEKLQSFVRSLTFHIDGKLDGSTNSKDATVWSGPVKIAIKDRGDYPWDVSGDVNVDFEKTPLNGEILKTLIVKSQIKLMLQEFGSLVTFLKPTRFSIPAPFHILRGPAQCAIEGELKYGDLSVPFACKTNLVSHEQSLVTNFNGTFGLEDIKDKYRPKLNLDATLNNVQLALPRFGITGLPPLLPDQRLKKSLKQVKAKNILPFLYRVSIKTADQPVRLLSNLASTPVGFDLNLLLESQHEPQGSIHVREFPLKLFRRDAKLKRFNLTLNDRQKEMIDGEVQLTYADYKIKITIWGTTKKPKIRFESEPPLDQNQIVSVLLFGKPVDELDSGQASSVSNTQAAAADRAIALTSMYVLASTPVESVGYNRESEMFSAKVRIQEGVSINVGADEERLRELGVNKHIKGPWYIYTYVRNPTESEARATAAFLEWVSRY
ncbi:MAG: translocation/assembly module TamB domain-containing protein [Oligoflexia bacterium]|nr:translocation/assembly module TamB domain-containing protein [Oligoflexia bacterium]